MTDARPVVLAPVDYYLPGYKAGGPIRTLAGVVEHLQDDFQFRILTRDRDLGDQEAYTSVPVNTWQLLGKAHVMYLPPGRLSLRSIRRLMSSTRFDVLYLNSCFSVPFTIVPLLLRRLRLAPHRPVIIGPRGELAPGALAFKSVKKRFFIAAARKLGLYRDVVWQSSGTHEAQEISRHFGAHARVVTAPDLVASLETPGTRPAEKKPGHLRILFVSRISRMKNLDGAISLLKGIGGSVQFNIYGPLEDAEYWRRCQELIAQLPPNISVEYGGPVAHERVGALMSHHDLLFLPTLGEAFGHVILEALAGGCPVLISDRTRWRGLESVGVGWDVPLEDPEQFREILRICVAMDSAAWREMSERASRFAIASQGDPEAREKNRALFLAAHLSAAAVVD